MYIIRSNIILTNLSICQQQSRCLMSSPNTQCTTVYSIYLYLLYVIITFLLYHYMNYYHYLFLQPYTLIVKTRPWRVKNWSIVTWILTWPCDLLGFPTKWVISLLHNSYLTYVSFHQIYLSISWLTTLSGLFSVGEIIKKKKKQLFYRAIVAG